MYAGRLAEIGPVRQVLTQPQHPYTAGLMGSPPGASLGRKRLNQIPGTMPGLSAVPEGCAYNPRCPRAEAKCRYAPPPPMSGNATCWFPGEVKI